MASVLTFGFQTMQAWSEYMCGKQLLVQQSNVMIVY